MGVTRYTLNFLSRYVRTSSRTTALRRLHAGVHYVTASGSTPLDLASLRGIERGPPVLIQAGPAPIRPARCLFILSGALQEAMCLGPWNLSFDVNW